MFECFLVQFKVSRHIVVSEESIEMVYVGPLHPWNLMDICDLLAMV